MTVKVADENHVPGSGELLNALTHAAGVMASVAGTVFLIIKALPIENSRYLVSFSIFGTSLILLYTSSTLYHALRGENIKMIFRRIDHAAIYILIAGTYTPFLLTQVRDPQGQVFFIIIWTIAIAGIILNVSRKIPPRWISASIYICMGWIAVIPYKELIRDIPRLNLCLILAGGLIYTSGTIFYVWKKLPYNHAIWHIFVIGGSACHYFAVYFLMG
ncbi:MAG TPA: hemolysin III family protein [Cyclobacteriaceae bacterium]|nr:hemolysin III family protein [Cyclobacteriaceae bacterium]